MSLKDGLRALQNQRYTEAIELLETYCQAASNSDSQGMIQAKMALAKAYRYEQPEKAIALCQELQQHLDSQVSNWATNFLSSLSTEIPVNSSKFKVETRRGLQDGRRAKPFRRKPHFSPSREEASPYSPSNFASLQSSETSLKKEENPVTREKAGRVAKGNIKLAMRGISANLSAASASTIGLLLGVVLALCFALILVFDNSNPFGGLIAAIIFTLAFIAIAFFVSPWIIDRVQEGFYQTRWVTMTDIERYSPEAIEVIRRVCTEKNLGLPRLGIVEDNNPTAFSYGTFRDRSRIVVSQGLFAYLDDDEIATVYAHELGHIVRGDFAVMTVASALIQISYLIYIFAGIGRGSGKNKLKNKLNYVVRVIAAAAYAFYLLGTYLTLYLSRTREYYADHFAAEVTGNPNGLSRALVKIAYGILEEGERSKEPSKLIEGTRTLGIYDPKAAVSTGTAYRVAVDSQAIGQVFLWDIFNPWGWLMEANSTHPLTGKRIRALTSYAEQLGIDTEFDMADAIAQGRQLSKSKLYANFVRDVIVYNAQWIGAIAGFVLGATIAIAMSSAAVLPSFAFFGFGIGTLVNAFVIYSDIRLVSQIDIFSLMCDPYASPLRGRPIQLQGELIGSVEAGDSFGSDLMIQDRTGTIYARYASRWGALGDFLFGATQVKKLMGKEVRAVGWFRRGVIPWLDLKYLKGDRLLVKSYPSFWLLIVGIAAIAFGFIVPILFKVGFFN
jgi:Zn-dependent protease with chaperone function